MASSQVISGSGLAMAKIIGFQFIRLIHYFLKVSLQETPIKTSAQKIASFNSPVSAFVFVISEISSLIQFIFSGLFLQIMPEVSQIIMFLTPQSCKMLAMLMPAAPAPLITTLHFQAYFSASLMALIKPAKAAIAVPCWSSWKTGSISTDCRLRSMEKHQGAFMSYRLIALYKWVKFKIALTVAYVLERGLIQSGIIFTLPINLNIIDLASMTGSPGMGPMLPNPKIAVPSVTITFNLEVEHY